MLQANLTHTWMDLGSAFEVDLEVQQGRLKAALEAAPGTRRDDLVQLAVADEGTLVEEEPYAAWALRPRDHLDWARQEARLVLARDRARGHGRSTLEAVVSAWEDCLPHDPTCEEAAAALMRLYGAQKRYTLVESTYNRCREALEATGPVRAPGSRSASQFYYSRPCPASGPCSQAGRPEAVPRRTALGQRALRRALGPLDGRSTAEPRRSLRARRWSTGPSCRRGRVFGRDGDFGIGRRAGGHFRRAGVPRGRPRESAKGRFPGCFECRDRGCRPLVASRRRKRACRGRPHRSARGGASAAVGEVVGAAAALQSGARPGSVLVGPATHAVAEGLFEWGPGEDVVAVPGAKPLKGRYLERP